MDATNINPSSSRTILALTTQETVNSCNDKDQLSEVPIAGNSSTVSRRSLFQSRERISQMNQNLTVEEKKLFLNQCTKYSWINGKFFEVDIDSSDVKNNKVSAKCNECDNFVQGSVTVSSNFTNHLKRYHDGKFDEYLNYKKMKRNDGTNERNVCRVTCRFSQDQFEQNVTNCILESHLPSHIVEKPGFRKIFNDFNIKCGEKPLKHLTAYKVGKMINECFEKQVNEIKNALSNVKFVCTTADIWSGKKRRFIGVTAHWIDEKTLQRKSAALACRNFPGTHSFENIAIMLQDIHTEYGLNCEKIAATITDNGSNFVKAFAEFGIEGPDYVSKGNQQTELVGNVAIQNTSMEVRISESNLEQMNADDGSDEDDNGNLEIKDESYDNGVDDAENENVQIENISEEQIHLPLHSRCSTHTLNLIATTDTIKFIKDDYKLAYIHERVLEKCKKLWKCLRSPKKREALTAYLGCCLQKSVVTRWNSLYDCLKQIYLLKEKLGVSDIQLIVELTVLLNEDDFFYINEYLHVFEPLSRAIDELQGEKNCYYGYLLPTIISIRNKWQKLIRAEPKHCKCLIKYLIQRLEYRFCDIFNVENTNGENAALAALLHPKFKLSWLSCLNITAQEKIKLLCQTLFQPTINTEERMEINDEEDFFDFSNNNGNENSITASFLPQGKEENELMRYLSKDDRTLESLNNFPLVKQLFLQFNTILPSSAPVERLFSQATLLDLQKNNRMLDCVFEKRVLAKINGQKHYL